MDMQFDVLQQTSNAIDVEVALPLSTETREVDDDITGLRDLTEEGRTVFDMYGQQNCEAIEATDMELGVPTAQRHNPQHRQEQVSISMALQTTRSDNFI